jgi:hypothetical protein
MLGSFVVYCGLAVAVTGFGLLVKPIAWLRVGTRARALRIAVTGAGLAAIGLLLPASESRSVRRETRLDEFLPVWQFREFHQRRVAAPPPRVFQAIRQVRADEIRFFRTLTWIRRGGRRLPPGILNAGTGESIVDVAIHGGFVVLADDPPRELVIGTVVLAPEGTRETLTPRFFQAPPPPGFVLGAMNFLVTPDGPDTSVVTTETRVFGSSASARRRFAAYWRLIYPGSALIRRMWLRAVERRAENR